MSQDNRDFTESPLYEEKFGGRENEAKGLVRFLAVLLAVLCVVFLPLSLYLRYTYVRIVVDGNSMNQTLLDGDTTYVDVRHNAEIGDIVVVDVSSYRDELPFSGNYIVKRLIAREGDSVYCDKNQVYVRRAGENEFKPLQEDYLSETAITADFLTVTVGEGEIFVMGDNRQDSYDSRRAGCFKEEDLLGFMPDWAYAMKDVFTKLNNTFGSN